ncbi:hypothetical protein [Mucilaginibacter sp. PAMB04168]|uniref:hypothetical protein n=1 Tax=Mucilaginibacter sp. PAMB04168 TaxID=3138567 RepID=UPI0031F63480
MKKILSVLTILTVLTAVSCQKSELKDVVNADNFFSVKQAAIASVNGPTTATVNQNVAFTVSWPYTGNCEKFSKFEADSLSDTTKIKLFTSTNIADDCTGKEVQHSSVYKFRAKKAGTYFLKFVGPDSNARPIVDTLTVK